MSRRKFLVSHDERRTEATPVDRLKCAGEVWGAALVTAGTAYYSSEQQKKAAETTAAGYDAASQVEWDMYQQSRTDQMPWLQAGQSALTQLEDLNSGDYSSFTESPDYQFALDQGIKSVDRSGSAKGTQYSGGQLAALADYSSGLASQNYSDYYNRIADLAGVGQDTAESLSDSGQSYADSASNLEVQKASDASDATLATASTYGQAASQISNSIGEWWKNRNSGTGTSMDPTYYDPSDGHG